jgi:hypothetical protein
MICYYRLFCMLDHCCTSHFAYFYFEIIEVSSEKVTKLKNCVEKNKNKVNGNSV